MADSTLSAESGNRIPLCCWCDLPATGEPVHFAGHDDPACVEHSRLFRTPESPDSPDSPAPSAPGH